MTKAKEKRRTVSIQLILTPNEMEQLKKDHARTIYRTRSDYMRGMLFDNKVTILYRNESFDDFMDECIRLRKLIQACKDIQLFGPEDGRRMLVLMEEVKENIKKIYEICMPK